MIDEVDCAVGQSGPGKCWNGFNHIPQLLFLTPQLPNAKSISRINQGKNATTHSARNQLVCQYSGAIAKSRAAPCSFLSPLSLHAITRNRYFPGPSCV